MTLALIGSVIGFGCAFTLLLMSVQHLLTYRYDCDAMDWLVAAVLAVATTFSALPIFALV